MRRGLLSLLLVGLLAAPLRGAAEPDARRTHDRILRSLGVEPGLLPRKVARGFRYRDALASGRSLAQGHKPRAFTAPASVYSGKELVVLTKAGVEQSYSPLRDPALRPVEDRAARQRAHGIFWTLKSRLGRELGVRPGDGLGTMALLEGGKADAMGACSLANGSIILHRGALDLSDNVARAVGAARSKRELLGNLLSVALGRVPEGARADDKAGRRIADGVLAVTIGHEMTHSLKRDLARGRARDVVQTPFGASSARMRAAELVADAGGAELALRGGYSPVGVLGFYLYLSVLEAYTGALNGPRAGTHPRGNQRYAMLYRYITERADARRPLYDGVHAPKKGPTYLSAADRKALASLPTPAELAEYLIGLPHGMGYVYPRSIVSGPVQQR